MPPIPTRAITIIGFAVLVAAMVVLEIIARRPGSRIPTVGQWLGYLMRPKLGRVLILAGWWWLGWHYFARECAAARGSDPPEPPDGSRPRSFVTGPWPDPAPNVRLALFRQLTGARPRRSPGALSLAA